MARQQLDQYGIRFRIWFHLSGYEWRYPTLKTSGRGTESLVPSGTQLQSSVDLKVVAGDGIRQIAGLQVSRKAFNQFRHLAKELESLDGSPTGVDRAKKLVVEYANQFGTLWDINDDRNTLAGWHREAIAFLDLYAVSKALRTAKYADVESGMRYPGTDEFRLEYVGGHRGSRPMRVARRGDVVVEHGPTNIVGPRNLESVDYLQVATEGSARTRALMLFSREVNDKLHGGLSFYANLLSDIKPIVTPMHLVHLLYLRMWLDTSDISDLERQTQCRECNQDIHGTSRKQFCDDECRLKFHNRNRRKGKADA